MDYKTKAVEKLILDLSKDGYKKQAIKLAGKILKLSSDMDLELLSKIKDSLGDSILELEYYPPGAGQFPSLQEVGIFFAEKMQEDAIKKTLERFGFETQGVMTKTLFLTTAAGFSSAAAEKLEDKDYLVISATMNPKDQTFSHHQDAIVVFAPLRSVSISLNRIEAGCIR